MVELKDLLEEVENALGRKLLSDLDLELSEGQWKTLIAQVGNNALEGYYADTIREQEHERDLWRQGKWDELYQAGKMPEDDYESLKEDLPNGNEWARVEARPVSGAAWCLGMREPC